MSQPAIDPHQSWLALEDAAAAHPDAVASALIRMVGVHMEAEIKGQIDNLMATLTEHPVYHFWGNGEPMVLEGREAVEGFYLGMFASKGQQFQVVTNQVTADANHVVTEGQVKQVYKGEALIAQGVTEAAGAATDPSALYLSNAQLITVWPADGDGKLVGEDIYFGVNPMTTLTTITEDKLPDYYEL